jgi:hypothetical protein
MSASSSRQRSVPSINTILPRRGAVKQIGGNDAKAASGNRGGFRLNRRSRKKCTESNESLIQNGCKSRLARPEREVWNLFRQRVAHRFAERRLIVHKSWERCRPGGVLQKTFLANLPARRRRSQGRVSTPRLAIIRFEAGNGYPHLQWQPQS